MGAALGEWRFIVWLGFAVIIDLCAVIAILELKRLTPAVAEPTEVAPAESDTQTSAATKIWADKNAHFLKHFTNMPQVKQVEIISDISKQHKRFTEIVAALQSGSIKPGKNAIQKEFNLGTATVDQIFEQLTQLDVIKRTEGKRTYELVNT